MLLTIFCKLSKSRFVKNELKSLPPDVFICVEVVELPCCCTLFDVDIRAAVDSVGEVIVNELSVGPLALAETGPEAASTFNFLATDEWW